MTCRHPVLRPFLFAALLVPALIAHCEEPREPSLFDEALTMSQCFDPDTDAVACRKTFGELVEKVRLDLKAAGITEANREEKRDDVIATLNRHLLVDRQVSYISNKYWRDSLFTAALMHRKGNCLATSLLYHLVAQELKLPIGIQFLPQHAMVSWQSADAPLYIETTSQGKLLKRANILGHYGLQETDLKPNGFLIPLTPQEIRAELYGTWSHMLESMGQTDEARKFLDKALAACPQNPGFRLQQAAFLHRLGQVDQAREMYQELLKADNGPFVRTTAARTWAGYLMTRGKIDDALAVLEAHWENAALFHKIAMIDQIGELYRHKRDWEKAIRSHQLHVKLDPGERSYDQLGSVLTEAQRDPEAIAAYESSLKYNPENFFTQVILAGLYERSGNKEKGRALFATIKEPRDNKITWYCALVWYYANIKEEEKLVENMRLALEMERSGHVYQYFIREPDLDPYRQRPAFKALMDAHAPKEERAPSKKAETEPAAVGQ
jgi:tetratricopeptide (TPR) repeat protein